MRPAPFARGARDIAELGCKDAAGPVTRDHDMGIRPRIAVPRGTARHDTREQDVKSMAAILATAGLAASALAAGHAAAAGELALVSRGGAHLESQKKAYVEPYIQASRGSGIVWNESPDDIVAALRAMNAAGNVTWDLVDVVASEALRLCDEGLAMKIDHDELLAPAPDGTLPSADFGDLIVSDCFIPEIIYSTAFGYRTDSVPEGAGPPNDICDLWDTETYPGKRSIGKRPVNNMEWALLCDGVPKDRIYEVLATEDGQNRALAKLDEIRDDVIWSSAEADTPDLLADGSVFMGSARNGRLFRLIEERALPVGMMWDSQVLDLAGWIIPAGLPEARLARVTDFIRFATGTPRMADLAGYISHVPARGSSASLVGTHAELGIDMAPHMPTDPDNAGNTVLHNYVFWAEHRGEIDARFRAWLAR